MPISTPTVLAVLRGIGEETRLRIVALLRHGELSVSDLTDILGQSQPRISRHLKLLADAGIVDRNREGTRAFFDLVESGPIAVLVREVLAHTDVHDATIAADLDRLEVVRRRRATAAQEYFAAVAERWDQVRSLHAPDATVEAAIVDAVSDLRAGSILDLGTGTGRMLQLLAADPVHVRRAVGLDNSHSMLAVARANLERSEIRHVDLRQGDVYSPPFDRDSFDLIVIHQVLHFLDDPARAVREAARLLTPGGRLLIVDLAPHVLEFLRTEHAHRRLGFRADTVTGWLTQSGLEAESIRTIDPPDEGDEGDEGDELDRLTVTLWTGRDRRSPGDRLGRAESDVEEVAS